MSVSPDSQAPPGVVELREDVPLKSGGTASRACASGPRFISAAFAVLSAAITIALLTQIYYGDYEVVPHGSVSSSAAECSRSGVLVLRKGGSAIDATVTAALCLAVLGKPHTSLDASGSLVHWEYRQSRTQLPTAVEWGGSTKADTAPAARTPRLISALAALHAWYGVLPWADVLQPAIDTARSIEAVPGAAATNGVHIARPASPLALADYLETFQHNTSAALCAVWRCEATVSRRSDLPGVDVGAWRLWTGGAGGAAATAALAAVGVNDTVVDATKSVISSLQAAAMAAGAGWPGGVASGLAVVDPADTYVALVTGLSVPFGSGAADPAAAGELVWTPDEPQAPLDLAPAILVEPEICGTRYVLGAESASALAQFGAAVLAGAGPVAAVETPRVEVLPGGQIQREPLAPSNPPLVPAINLVQQKGDALLSHADSRGGGLAERF